MSKPPVRAEANSSVKIDANSCIQKSVVHEELKEIDGLILGTDVQYEKRYSPDVLTPVPRSLSRELSGINQSGYRFFGYDEWTLYELVWLDAAGSPQARIGKLSIPADSSHIVESKSLKLYLNSLFYKSFDSDDEAVNTITSDLGRIVGANVFLEVFYVDCVPDVQANDEYQSLDDLGARPSGIVDPDLLQRDGGTVLEQFYVTHRFRSLCPVTSQPDWACVFIQVLSPKIVRQSLANYLMGFSEHSGFHESCVETIYMDLMRVLEPEELQVAARFTRRGGVDINPVRATSLAYMKSIGRTSRQ